MTLWATQFLNNCVHWKNSLNAKQNENWTYQLLQRLIPVALLPSSNSMPMSLSTAKQPLSVQCSQENDNTVIAQPSRALARTCFWRITLTLQNNILFILDLKLPPITHATHGTSSHDWFSDIAREHERTRDRLSNASWELMRSRAITVTVERPQTYITTSYNCAAFKC